MKLETVGSSVADAGAAVAMCPPYADKREASTRKLPVDFMRADSLREIDAHEGDLTPARWRIQLEFRRRRVRRPAAERILPVDALILVFRLVIGGISKYCGHRA
jgi:hypothetical protein